MKPDASQRLPERTPHRLVADVYADPRHVFHFTLCARQQGQPFGDESLAKAVVDSLLWTRERYGWVLFCYCLMPDHLHLVCRPTEAESRFFNGGARGMVPEGALDHVGRFKSFTTTQSWKLGFRGPLWQRSSYDRVFDLDWPFEEVAMYVLENPVRKGIVEQWEDWPYSRIVDPWEETGRPSGTDL